MYGTKAYEPNIHVAKSCLSEPIFYYSLLLQVYGLETFLLEPKVQGAGDSCLSLFYCFNTLWIRDTLRSYYGGLILLRKYIKKDYQMLNAHLPLIRNSLLVTLFQSKTEFAYRTQLFSSVNRYADRVEILGSFQVFVSVNMLIK